MGWLDKWRAGSHSNLFGLPLNSMFFRFRHIQRHILLFYIGTYLQLQDSRKCYKSGFGLRKQHVHRQYDSQQITHVPSAKYCRRVLRYPKSSDDVLGEVKIEPKVSKGLGVLVGDVIMADEQTIADGPALCQGLGCFLDGLRRSDDLRIGRAILGSQRPAVERHWKA